MKGIGLELEIFIKLMSMLLVIISLLGMYMSLTEFNVTNAESYGNRMALQMAESLVSCSDIISVDSAGNPTRNVIDIYRASLNAINTKCLPGSTINYIAEVYPSKPIEVSYGLNSVTYSSTKPLMFTNTGVAIDKNFRATLPVAVRYGSETIPGTMMVYVQ